jgi:hypothetical protein
MLPELDRQLLTAYVDGELSARQMRLVLKLLRRSAEARELLNQLQDHARIVRQLPRIRSNPALSDSVIQTIRARRLHPQARTATPNRGLLPAWGGYAAAAAVFIAVSAASYLLFAHALDRFRNGSGGEIASPSDLPKPDLTLPPEAIVKGSGPTDPEMLPVAPVPEKPVEQTPIVQLPPRDDRKPIDPEPDKPKDPPVLTYPATDMVELKMVDIAAPVILKVSDLEQAKTKDGLLGELNKAAGFRIEFPCRNGTRAFERFQASCKSQEIALNVDQTAAERLKHPQFRSNYAIYLEDLTAEELTRLLQQVAAEDKKTDGKKPTATQFDRLVLVRMTNRDRKELSELLGTDPTASAGPAPVDIHKPVSDQTASQIAATLTGQGGAPSRPDSGKPGAKAPDHAALVVPYLPQHPSANSTEVKRYLENRKPARPGTLQLYLVIRETP